MEEVRDPRFNQWCELVQRSRFGPELIQRLQANDVFDILTIEMIDEEFLAANELKQVEIDSCILWKNDILAVSERPISKWIELLKTASFGKRIVSQMREQQVLDFLQLEDVDEDLLHAFKMQQWQIDCVLEWRNQCLAEDEAMNYPYEEDFDDNESIVSSVISSLHSDFSPLQSDYDGDMMEKLNRANQELQLKDAKIQKLMRKVDKKKVKIKTAREDLQSSQSMLISRDANLRQARHQLHLVIADRVMCRNTLTNAGRKMQSNIENLQALLEGQIMSCEGKMEEIQRKYVRIAMFMRNQGATFHSKAQNATVHALTVELEMLQDTLRNESSEHERQKRDMQKQINILSGVNGGSIERELSMMLQEKETRLSEALAHARASHERSQVSQREIQSIQKSFRESIAELERLRSTSQAHERARLVLQQKVDMLMGELAGNGGGMDGEMQSEMFDMRQQQHQEQIAELERQVRMSMQTSSQEIIKLREKIKTLEHHREMGISKFQEVAEENMRLKETNDSNLLAENEELRAHKEELEKKEAEHTAYIAQLEDRLRSASVASSMSSNSVEVTAENKQLRAALKHRDDKIEALAEAQKSLARGNSILEEKIVDLKAQLMDAETARARLSHNLQRRDSASSPKAGRDEVGLWKQKLANSQKQYAHESEKNKALEGRIGDLQGHFQQLQGKMEHFQKTHQETMQEKKKQIGDMQNLNMEQKEVISNLKAELRKLQAANKRLASDGGSQKLEHQQQIGMLKKQVEQMTEKFEDAKIEINRLESQLSSASKEASSKSDSIQSAVEDQGRKVAALEKKELKMNKQIELLVRAKENAEKELAEKRDELVNQKKASGEMSEKVGKLTQDCKALKSQVSFKTKHAAELQENIDSLKAKQSEAVAKLNKQIEQEKDALQENFKMEKAGLERSVKFLSSKTRKMEKSIRKEYDQCQNLKAALFNIREEQDSMKEVIATQMKEASRTLKQAFKQSEEKYEKINATAKREMGLRKKYWNIVQDLRGNVRVFCRVRPLLGHEMRKGYTSCLDFPEKDQLNVALFDKKSNQTYSHFFEFDKVYPPNSSQEQVCKDTSEYIQSVMDGYHVSIFAFGQTGSGKTYTMMGPAENPGVNRRALQELFTIQERRKQFFEYEVRLALFEIYNDRPRDLLAKKPKVKYEVKDDINGNPHIPGLVNVPVTTIQDVLDQIDFAEQNRSVAMTKMNTDSSRSHMCLEVTVHGLDKSKNKKIEGRLYLVDLAGSERVGKSGVTGKALQEAKHINKSLSSLGDVMAALQKKEKFIPYRNSTLTKIMQNALSPNGKTVMFVNICPTNEHVGETLSSLKFAKRVGKVELGSAKAQVKKSRSRKGTIESMRPSDRRKMKQAGKLDSLASELIGSSPSNSSRSSASRSASRSNRRKAGGSSTQV